jgi:hypothetical protein
VVGFFEFPVRFNHGYFSPGGRFAKKMSKFLFFRDLGRTAKGFADKTSDWTVKILLPRPLPATLAA